MKILEVRKVIFEEALPDLDKISAKLDSMGQGVLIDTLNWGSFGYKPEVRINMAYSDSEIFLKYYVKEESVKAEKTESNQMVCEDSCVEFFVSPEEDGIYYNFEFNAIGTCLFGSGTSRGDITRAQVSEIKNIRRKGSSGTEMFNERAGESGWTLTIAIPVSVFYRHNIKDLGGKTFRANFYKCGDKLSRPHYLTWNPVGTVNPDFHRPEYFGLIKFV